MPLSSGLSFMMSGTDFVCAAAWLTQLGGDKRPLTWAKRLANRYVEARHPETGLGASNFTVTDSHRMEKQFPQFQGRFTEATVTDLYGARYSYCAICQLRLAEMLGPDGKEFLRWGVEDLTARATYGYDEQANDFSPMLIDGTELSPADLIHPGYVAQRWLEKRPANERHFLAYALAYKLGKDPLIWRMARSIGLGLGLGDLGATPGKLPSGGPRTDADDPLLIFGLLELHSATGAKAYLDLAGQVGENALRTRFHKGFFVASKDHLFALFDDPTPLALLHLRAVLIDSPQRPPAFWGGKGYFHCRYDGAGRTYDRNVIHGQLRERQ